MSSCRCSSQENPARAKRLSNGSIGSNSTASANAIRTSFPADRCSEWRSRALAHSPRILLADEPTGNLDTTTGTVILDLLLRLTHERKTATIMATHSHEAAAVADTLVVLRDGQIAEITRR